MLPIDNAKYVVVTINNHVVVTKVLVEERKWTMISHGDILSEFLKLARKIGDLSRYLIVILPTAFFGLC